MKNFHAGNVVTAGLTYKWMTNWGILVNNSENWTNYFEKFTGWTGTWTKKYGLFERKFKRLDKKKLVCTKSFGEIQYINEELNK